MIKSVVLKGVKIEIGDKVRFIDDRELYPSGSVIKPELGKVYEVSGFTTGADRNPGFTLVGIENSEILGTYFLPCGEPDVGYVTPGFAIRRFEPARPLVDMEEMIESISNLFGEDILTRDYELN